MIHTHTTQPSAETIIRLQTFYAVQAQAIDAGASATWAATFTADGKFDSPTYGRPIVGTTALEDFVNEFHRTAGSARLRHWFSTFSFENLAEDRIRSQFYGMIVRTTPGSAPEILRSFLVVDELRAVDGEWRVSSRKVTVDGSS